MSFEGTEGSGKSTLIESLAKALARLDIPFIKTREPGGTILAEKLRRLILDDEMMPLTELFLYEAARAQHWHDVIRPALLRGDIVLCDRFIDSTLAYQGSARGLRWNEIDFLNLMATEGKKPDLTLFLDIDPAQGLSRAQDKNRFEAEGVAFQEKVRRGFLKARRRDVKRWATIRIKKQTVEELRDEGLAILKTRFPHIFPRAERG